MKRLFALFACLLFAMPISADEALTTLMYQHVKEQPPELGPLFKDQFPDIDADRALDTIMDGLPDEAAICVATKTANGVNFLVGKNRANVLTYYVNVGNDGSVKVIPLNEAADTGAAGDLTIFGSTHIIWTVVPDGLTRRGLSDKEVVALLKATADILEALVKTQKPGVPI